MNTFQKIVVIVCGPAHSGKSVFVQQLRRLLLPLGLCAVIEGCPDGEGGWANVTDGDLAKSLRKKGKFTTEFVDWVVDSITQSPMPICLVDVGGVRSPENERIFAVATHFIVLANPAKVGEMEAWEAFGRANGCEPAALLESLLPGDSRLDPVTDGPIMGLQTGLERGHRVGGPVIEAVVNRLLDLVGRPSLGPGEAEATVNFGQLATALGIPADAKGARMGFRPWHAAAARALSHEALTAPLARLWGAAPGWLYSLMAAAASVVQLFDIRLGYVALPELTLATVGSNHLTWETVEAEGNTLIAFTIPGGVADFSALSAITPPAVAPDATVLLSGRGPHWLTAAVVRAYARAGHRVACLAPNETGPALPDGRAWSEAYVGLAPYVLVAGPAHELGQVVTGPRPQ